MVKTEGWFYMAWLPEYLDTRKILADAVRNKVFRFGSGFILRMVGLNEARLAFSTKY